MSLCADEIRLLVDGGSTTEDLITVARAMEGGDDRRGLMRIIDSLIETDASDAVIAAVWIASAKEILERRLSRQRPAYDPHTGTRDSNRSRRNMRNDLWRELRGEVLSRDQFRCVYCGAQSDLTADHVVPLVRGGTNDIANLATACRPCNSSKSDRLLSEWGGRRA